MPASLKSAALAAVGVSLLFCRALLGAEGSQASLDSLWEKMADRSAATAYRAARQMIERGDQAVVFLATKIPAAVRLPRRVPYEKPQDLQLHRAAYVLECVGSKDAERLRARITYAPAAAFQLYQEKQRLDVLGDALPSGAVFRWGSDRFFVTQNRAGLMAISNDGKLAAMAPFGFAMYRRVGGVVYGDDSGAAIKVWDLATGQVKWQLPFIGMRPSLLRFTGDNKRIVYSADGQIVVVEIATGAVIHQISTGIANLNAFALSDDEHTIYTGHADGSFAAYEFPGGSLISKSQIVGRTITRLHVSPEFVSVECGGARGIESRLWDVRHKDWTIKKAWGEPLARYALSPDGKRYAVLKPNGPIELRGMADDKLQKELAVNVQLVVPARTGRERFEFIAGQHLLITDWANNTTVVSADSGKTIWSGRILNYRMEVCVSADGRYLLGSEGGRLQVIDLTTGRNLVEAYLARLSNPYLTVSSDGGTVLALREQRLWQLDPSTFELLGEVKMEGHPQAISHDGRFCIMSEPPAVWEPASATQLLPLNEYGGGTEHWIFHPNGRWLIEDSRPGMSYAVVDLWTASRRADRCAIPAYEIACAPDGRSCLCRDQRNQQWTCCDVASGMPLWRGPAPGYDSGCRPQWFAGGRFAAFPSGAFFEVRDGKDGRVVDMIATGGFDVRNCAVAPDGGSLTVADGAGLRIYERCSRKLLFECPARGSTARYLPSGRFVEVADLSGMTAICDLSSAAAKRKPGETATAELARLWPDLSGPDARAAFAASWSFAAAGDEAVAYLHQRLVAERESSDEQIRHLIAQLDNDRYELRQAAYARLLEMGRRIVPKLKAAADDPVSLELQLALDKLVRTLESNQGPPVLPRAAFILRQIGTPEAEELLAELGEYSAQKAFAPLPAPRGS